MHIMIPTAATRRGYGYQNDTTIDYFIYNEHFKKHAKFDLKVISGINISDHNLLILDITFDETHRKLSKNVIEITDNLKLQKISLKIF